MSDPAVPFESGLFLVDKPSGPTSHDAVAWARRALRNRRIGHCGTLDPMASGLLILAAGAALKLQEGLSGERKVYTGRMRFGLVTDTDDVTGKVLRRAEVAGIDEARLREAFAAFTGRLRQRVPKYSAAKVKGRKLYEWARAGVDVPLPEKDVDVYRFDLASWDGAEAGFTVECSKGTYVRSLARDVGEKLGAGAALSALCRESIGRFARSAAFAWKPGERVDDAALAPHWIPAERLQAVPS